MIEMLEGVPGSGKSYYAVSERLLKWVRANRRIYVYVEGFHVDRLAVFEGREVDALQKQITLWQTVEEVRLGLLTVEPGAGVLIDEVQTVFRSKEKQDPALLRWLETHRHRGIDIVMMCQQYGQVTLGVNRLVEATTKFRRLDRFGLKHRYQAAVRGNPEEVEIIRMFVGKYSPKLYAYYSSYSQASARETVRGGSILKSPILIVGVLGLAGAVGWFMFGGWMSGVAPVQTAVASKLPPPLTLPDNRPVQVVEKVKVPEPPVVPVRILGGMSTLDGNGSEWLWLSAEGRVMTMSEIAAESGGTVFLRTVRGVRVLRGTGVVYGPVVSEGNTGQLPHSVYQFPSLSSGAGVRPMGQSVPDAPVAGPPDPFATPPGILATPKGF